MIPQKSALDPYVELQKNGTQPKGFQEGRDGFPGALIESNFDKSLRRVTSNVKIPVKTNPNDNRPQAIPVQIWGSKKKVEQAIRESGINIEKMREKKDEKRVLEEAYDHAMSIL